jgi:GntR family transcriptional regulator, transcriptional repressor for pyruvate dehydrogenase complex
MHDHRKEVIFSVMKVNPIRKKRVYQEIIEQIKEAIKKGDIKPGDRLPAERELAKSFSVSRSSIKEAITVLESTGIVEIRTGVGTFLKETEDDIPSQIDDIINDSVTNVLELMEFRQTIEADAAYYAAIRADKEQKAKLQAIFDSLESSVHSKHLSAKKDFEFHMTIATIAGNSITEQVMSTLSDKLLKVVTHNIVNTLISEVKREEVFEEHRQICEAISSGDGEKARRKMWKHLQGARDRYEKLHKQ